MNLTKVQKQEKSAKVAQEFKKACAIFFASYQGLKFKQIAVLREKLSAAKCSFRVERNVIVNHAVKGAGIKAPPQSALCKGPTAIAVQDAGDVVEAARVLAAFEKDFPALKLKACYSPDEWLDAEGCKRLSTLGTRTETLAQLAGSLHSCVSRAASVLQAPITGLAFALKAVEEKKSGQAAA